METPTPHEPMTVDENERVGRLSAHDIELIDDALAMHVTERHQKAAMIIALAMRESSVPENVPDLYYFERLKMLVENGSVEMVGYSDNMRFCELRLRPISITSDQ